MEKIVFDYKGRQHSAQLISSTNIEPHYHWVYFNDEDIITSIKDDCIGFKKKGSQLQPTRIFANHSDLVETVKKTVEEHIN